MMSNTFFIITMLCISNSMGDTLGCGDRLYSEPVTFSDTDTGEWGALYAFTYPGVTDKPPLDFIVHRLIYTYDNYAVFRGDNNNFMEVVPKNDIKYKVKYVIRR